VPALLLIAAGLLVAGCSGFGSKDPVPVAVDPNLLPSDYKAQLVALLRTRLADPTSVRDAYVSEPMLKQVGSDSRYVVCVRYDAKSTYGRYIGSKDHMAFFLAGRINQFVDATNDYCGGANYQPFPEAQAIAKPS
jgi:hypothetical protein